MGPIGLALLSNSALAAVLAAIAELTWRLRKPALAHAIWVLAIVKLLTPPLWHIPIPSHSAPPAAAIEVVASPIEKPVAVNPGPKIQEVTPTAAVQPVVSKIPARVEKMSPKISSYAIPATWVTGSAALQILAVIRVRRFSTMLRNADFVDDNLAQEIREIAHRLGVRSIGAMLVPADIPPMVWFIGRRPTLLFGRGFSNLEPDRRAAIIAHELAHVQRRDHCVRLLELLATIVLWWHPLVWLARHRLRAAEEEACDAWVVWAMPQARRAYANVLVEMARGLTPRVPACASGLGGFGILQRRLVMILEKTPKRSLGLGGWAAVSLLAISLPLAASRVNRASAAAQTPPASNPAPAADDVTTSAVTALLNVTINADQQMQQTATNSILTFGPKAIPVLIDGMNDPAKAPIAKSLLAQFGIDAVDPLIAALKSDDPDKKLDAIMVLATIAGNLTGQGGAPGFSPQPQVNFEAGGPPSGGMLVPPPAPGYSPFRQPGMTLGAFATPGGPVPTDPRIPQTLQKIESAMAAAIDDQAPEIRLQATALLGKLAPFVKDDAAVDDLIRSLGDNADDRIRVAAAQALAAMDSKAAKAVPALIKMATDSGSSARFAAIWALGMIGPAARDAMPTVVNALNDDDEHVRLVAAQALGNMNRNQP